MKAVILEKVKTLKVKDIPIPNYDDDEVLIHIKEVGLCGSDIHFYNTGKLGNFLVTKPIILGHECSGIIEDVGKKVKKLKVGDRVAIEPGISCGRCYFCKLGKYNLCENVFFMSAPPNDDGALREYISHNSNFVYKISKNISYTEGVLVEPLSVGYHALVQAEVKAGCNMCITGAGPIGLCCLEIAKAMGIFKIFISDVDDFRLEIATNHGAFKSINPKKENLEDIINEYTNKNGVDYFIEASGSEVAINQAIKLVKKGGTIVLVGWSDNIVPIFHSEILSKEITIKGINRYRNTYVNVINLLEGSIINVKDLSTHRFKLTEIKDAFEIAINKNVNKMKIIIEI